LWRSTLHTWLPPTKQWRQLKQQKQQQKMLLEAMQMH